MAVIRDPEALPAAWAGVGSVVVVVGREREVEVEVEVEGANVSMVRRVAVSLLRRAGTKGSLQTRRTKAAWEDDYLLQVLQGLTAKENA